VLHSQDDFAKRTIIRPKSKHFFEVQSFIPTPGAAIGHWSEWANGAAAAGATDMSVGRQLRQTLRAEVALMGK
jgi:hypothetical protein